MKGKFRFIEDLTSDVVFEAQGRDRKELFENAALALSSVICQTDRIKPLMQKEIVVEGEDLKDLMHNWLQKVIELVDVEQLFFSKFEVKEMSDTRLKAIAYGEESDPRKGGTVVKAVTYYKFNVEKTRDGFKATVALDI